VPFSTNYSKGNTHDATHVEKTFTLISNVLGNGLALSWSHQLPPTKTSKNPIKIWNL
jgi:hypothetical protein